MKLTAETWIKTDRGTVWRLSQTPDLHVRWDLRFSFIEYLPRPSQDQPQRFRYATKIGFGKTIEGWGETLAHSEGTASALKFGSEDPKSLIREGSGSWTYEEKNGLVRFSTTYDYTTRFGFFGRMLDCVFRPLMIWAVRWSFDRLRIWIEDGTPPEVSRRLWFAKISARCALGAIWIYEGLMPKILAQRASEITLVHKSSLYWGSPEQTLAALGLLEMCFGFLLLLGIYEKTTAFLSALGVMGLAGLVVFVDPSALSDPFGGISKNIGLLACAVVVVLLSDYSPMASRACRNSRANNKKAQGL